MRPTQLRVQRERSVCSSRKKRFPTGKTPMRNGRSEMNSVAPRWSLDTIYPGPTSREFTKDIAELKRAITEAESAIEDTSLLERDSLQWLRTALPLYNRCTDLFENLESYSYSIYSVDTSDRQAQNAITTVGTL